MTYEQIVERVRGIYEHGADARDIFEHVALQINIEGEGHGAFYIEIANRQICVEPYEYYDRDAIITITADNIFHILDGEIPFEEAYQKGLFTVQGDIEKARLWSKVRMKKTATRKKKRVVKSEKASENDAKKE